MDYQEAAGQIHTMLDEIQEQFVIVRDEDSHFPETEYLRLTEALRSFGRALEARA